MKVCVRLIAICSVAIITLAGGAASRAGPAQIPGEVVGFQQDGGPVNIDPTQNSLAPALTLGSLTGGAPQPWLASTESNAAGLGSQVVVTEFNSANHTWEQRGASLNHA